MSAIAGHVALVTGASSGIGAAIASALESHGARVCRTARRIEPAPSRGYPADLCEDAHIEALASALLRDHGGVDILVHAAGVFEPGTDDAKLDRQYRTNVRAPLILTRALLPSLRSRQGQIVFVNSSAGLNARAASGSYAATKHALKALADGLREEVNPDGVRVLSVFPGRTATPMQEQVHATEGRPYRAELLMQPEDVASIVVHALTLPRRAEVTEIMIRPLLKSY